MVRNRQAESAKEAAKQKRKNRDSMVRNCQAESAKESAKQKRKNRDSMVRNPRLNVPKKLLSKIERTETQW